MSPQPSPSSAPWPQSLIDVLECQRALVDELSKLATDQAALIADGRTEQLMELLGRRQGVIDRFTASQSNIGELTRDLDARFQSDNVQQPDLIRSLIDGIGQQLAEVMKRDEHDQASLRSGRDQVRRDIAALGAGQAARNAYLNGSTSNPRFADQRG